MNSLPAILVIIVTWNKKEYVIDLLNSLTNLNYPAEQLDIVVVDNASTDGTVEELQTRFTDIHLIANTENLGGCGGFNTGLAWAFDQPVEKYDYLWLLDNDVQVHSDALKHLVTLLQQNEEIAVAGSTMMQLTYPWRINEMGAFVDRGCGALILNRHKEDVSAIKGKALAELLGEDLDLSRYLKQCQPWMDVDYVAAASLLIRSSVARRAGLWDDYFIHFDDVEWCLRIAQKGHRIAVSARSLIWHLPAESKVPTWILYYDNRNVLYLLDKHSDAGAVSGTRRWTLKKSLYYALLGKRDLADLHLEAIQDYDAGKTGKKDIKFADCYRDRSAFQKIIEDPEVKRILLPWTVDLQAADLQAVFVRVMKKRPDLRVDYLLPATFVKDALMWQLPGAIPLRLPDSKIRRMMSFFRIRKHYDLVLQSDYQQILPLSWIAKQMVFVNYDNISVRRRTTLKEIYHLLRKIWTLH